MNAAPLLAVVSRVLARHRLDAVVIGNAAAALQGSPVTTLDIDFMFRRTPTNLRKLKAIADDLEAVVLRPYYPASELFRVVRDRDGLQLDFMAKVDGVRSFEALKARATRVPFGEHALLVASLRDIIRSKERAGRPQDLAVLPRRRGHAMSATRTTRTKTAEPKVSPRRRPPPRRAPSALARESERALVEQIRRLLALPPQERTHFLRVRLPWGGSSL